MTRRQNEIYLFVLEFYREHGYSPTIGEICKGCYTTSYTYIRETLWRLEEMGLLKIEDGKHRAISIKEYR